MKPDNLAPEKQRRREQNEPDKNDRVSTSGWSSVMPCPSETQYNDVVAAMNSTLSMGLFRIEILPNSHTLPQGLNVLVENAAVGTISLTKRTLKNAFVIARNVFFKHLALKDQLKGKDKQTFLDDIAQCHEALLDSSAVILLLVPEDYTALNTRKRVIVDWENEFLEKGRKRVVMDLCMLDNIFCSPLNKHTKSPFLWAHRRWLTERLPSPEPRPMERCSNLDLRKDRDITIVVMTAGTTHPRNYYAWEYIRWWIAKNPEILGDFGHFSRTQSDTDSTTFGLSQLANTMRDWCLQHPSDTSGWSFLLWLLTMPATSATGTLQLYGPFGTIIEDVLDRMRSLRLRNESLWVFLRTVMSSKDISPELLDIFVTDAKEIADSGSERSNSRTAAGSALKWLEKHGQMAPPSSTKR